MFICQKIRTMIKPNYKNGIKVLQFLSSLALYASIAFAVYVVGAFIFTLNDEGELISTWDVEVSEVSTDFQLTPLGSSINDPKLIIDKGTIQFSSDAIGYFLLKFIDAVIVIAAIIYMIILLKRTLNSIYHQHPFSIENAQRIKYIAILLMVFSPYCLIRSLVYRGYIINNISIGEKSYVDFFNFSSAAGSNQLWLNLDLNLQSLITGIVLFVIAEVFRVGVLIKEDNDSIL